MSNAECQIHHVIEISDENTYRECGECWHVFQTEEQLVNARNRVWEEMGSSHRVVKGNEVYACPECAHDF